MRVDIWSDIRCPFCYIGKHNFEDALEKFEHKEDVQVVWHSFQLDSNLQTQPEISTIDYFTKAKGIPREQALQMFDGAKKMAAETGLTLDLEKSVVANSFKSHQLLQYAKTKGLGDEIKEALFEAHFTRAQNIDDEKTLLEIAASTGLDKEETEKILSTEEYAHQVNQDDLNAKKLGISGVPFFVFNNKYGVSGAQSPETFLDVLEKSWEESSTA